MLAMFSMVLVVPVSSVKADPIDPTGAQPLYLCINRNSGEVKKLNGTACPAGTDQITGAQDDGSGHALTGLCLKQANGTSGAWQAFEIGPDVTSNGYELDAQLGKTCVPVSGTGQTLVYTPYSSMPLANTGDTTGGTNTNINTNTGGTNNNSNGTRNPGGNSNGNTSSTPQVQGDCDSGFHKVGPLCVPNSPFSNQDALVNKRDFPSLATTIIKILLYFAGIVAVIFVIIGGYQIMTAQGNASQATNGRKTLTNAIIGLVIIVLAYIIIQAVVAFITK